MPGYESYTWNPLFARAGTPKEIVEKLNAAAKTALADPDLIKRKGEFSATIVASTPDAPKTHVSEEFARWGPIVKDANIRLD